MPGLILPYKDVLPVIAGDAFIAPTATVIGNVEIGAQSSLWFNVIVRGDVGHIHIGDRTNLQDGTIVHVTQRENDTWIGSDVLVGHAATIHGCRLEDGCFVGMGTIILDGAVIESGAMVAAAALVTPGKRIKTGELWGGCPAKFMREMTEDEVKGLGAGAEGYRALGQTYRQALDSTE